MSAKLIYGHVSDCVFPSLCLLKSTKKVAGVVCLSYANFFYMRLWIFGPEIEYIGADPQICYFQLAAQVGAEETAHQRLGLPSSSQLFALGSQAWHH